MPSAVCSLVSKNVAIGGGTEAAIDLISSSPIGPGPDGIFPTNPIADAPEEIAIFASSSLEMQQILILIVSEFESTDNATQPASTRSVDLFWV